MPECARAADEQGAPTGSERKESLPRDGRPEPGAPGPSSSAVPEEPDPPGFAQTDGDTLRVPRLRIEGAFQAIFFDAKVRHGHAVTANGLHLHEDLGVPDAAPGVRATAVLKLHRFVAVGAGWQRATAEGSTNVLERRVAFGAARFAPGQRAAASVEVQQADLDVRLVAADDARFRAEIGLGAAWTGFRLGIHPREPLLPGAPFSEGPVRGESIREEDAFGPALGLFFAWSFHERVAIFVENRSAYFAPARFGSYASWIRAGLRVHLGEGVELLLAGAWTSGQNLELRDSGFFTERGRGHVFRQTSWYGGGPEVGLAFTY